MWEDKYWMASYCGGKYWIGAVIPDPPTLNPSEADYPYWVEELQD